MLPKRLAPRYASSARNTQTPLQTRTHVPTTSSSTSSRHLQHKHPPNLTLPPQLLFRPTHRISNPSPLRPNLLVEHPQPLGPIDPPIRQHHGVVLDDTLRMMCIRHIACEFVELGAADGAHGCGGGRSVCGAGGEGGMAGGRFEGAEAGGEGDVEEGPRGERVQRVVGCEEEGGEVGPAGWGIEGLSSLALASHSLLLTFSGQ